MVQVEEELARRGYAAKVEVGFYLLDRLVLSAEVQRWPSEEEGPTWPWFFRGFVDWRPFRSGP